jgi:hypothetical protein
MRAFEFIQELMKAAQQAGPGTTINIGEINIDSDEEREEVTTALDTDRMVPPLQTKIELLRKSVGQRSKDPIIANEDDLLDD